jgi:hypothetical protein
MVAGFIAGNHFSYHPVNNPTMGESQGMETR